MSRPQEKIHPGGDAVITGAHRFRTIMHVHQILVNNDGEIVEQGIHDEMMTVRGFYHNLVYIRQFEGRVAVGHPEASAPSG